MTTTPAQVLDFWFDELGPDGWFGGGPRVDDLIRRRFASAWRAARGGAFESWQATPEGTLALLLILDQFPRNMHRGSGLSFATDARGLRVARRALARGQDLALPEEARRFLYLPFTHSERLTDQDRSVGLFVRRLGVKNRARNRAHARAHRAVIEQFGRFPYRNEALGRETTPEEAAWLRDVGYMGEVRRFGG
ncbi:DUF924 domain-containing protein [Albimonas sp. CAU 1670]|uniref:DUF924 family protein n=1 Tax=Albimonas sp. CAU 1670 TaxID=3032599 RepID=UPI0023DCE540|nr:DUF924 family protein [Albimonas sp. CAU 1670]MDF2232224.1 DUF924 domain-containing protein [Albimonas sp. CAU 1670]